MRRGLVVGLLAAGAAVAARKVPRVRRLKHSLETLGGVHVGSAINPAAHVPD